MFDIPGVAVLIGLAALFGWLAWRAWHAGRRVLKWSGTLLAGLLRLAFTAALAVALVGYARLNRKYDNPVPDISVAMTPENIARGARFGSFCAACHAEDQSPPLGGQDFMTEGDGPPVGTLYAPNLTPTHLAEWTDGEIVRAIREGVHRSGRSLIIMPSSMFRNLSDEDVRGIVAYLRSQPRLEPDTPPTRLNVLGAILVNLGPIFEAQPPITEPVVAPAADLSAEYGEHLASFACILCHGAELGGVELYGSPGLLGPGLSWTAEQFIDLIRTGLRPDGSALDAEEMPWEALGEIFPEDDELRAIFAHVASLARKKAAG